jgi:glutathione S-transferase
MHEAFTLIGRDWWQGPWVFGSQYTVADPYLYTIGEWLEGDGVDTAAFPGCWNTANACARGRRCSRPGPS